MDILSGRSLRLLRDFKEVVIALCQLVLISGLHLHCEEEFTASVDPFGFNIDEAVACLHNLLYDGEPEADTRTVHSCSPVQLAEAAKQKREVFWGDSYSRVLYMDDQAPNVLVVVGLDLNGAAPGEFDRVFDQVDHNLLESPLVPD